GAGGAGLQNTAGDTSQLCGRSGCRRERPFVGDELDDMAKIVDQRQAVGRAVLQSIMRKGEGEEAEPVAGWIRNGARQRGYRPAGGIRMAVGAVVADDRPSSHLRSGNASNLEELADVGAMDV